ncbi:MAG: hypothetical protein ACJAZ9_000197 [Neolewinella sp.]|jgi:hypothetical protein
MHQYFRILLFPLLALLLLTTCSPAKKLAKEFGVNKRVLKKALLKEDANGNQTFIRRVKGFDIAQVDASEIASNPIQYLRYDSLKTGKFYGPFPSYNNSIHYLRKLGVREVPYATFLVIQFHQLFGISDELFNQRMDDLLAQATAKPDSLVHILEDFPDDEELGVGLVLEIKQDDLKNWRPEAKEFILSAPLMSIRKSKKVKYPNTTITEVIVKNYEIVTFKHIDGARITIRKPLKKQE